MIMAEAQSLLTDQDIYLFNEGTWVGAYEKLGAPPRVVGGAKGINFAVWAPSAERVSVIGDFNGWERGRTPLAPRGSSGIWEGFVPEVTEGALYKYAIDSRYLGYRTERADPYAFYAELRPNTASIVYDIA